VALNDDDSRAAPLAGRIALVTGGARRIGRQLVLDLARGGADVIIHHLRSAAEAEATAKRASQFGGRTALVRGDLGDQDTPAAVVAEAARLLGPLDILVNNASLFEPGSALETATDTWRRHQTVNLTAPFLLSQAFARQLPDDREGDIVNLNDIRGLRPGADHFAYTISKVGLHGLTVALAQELAPRIRVNELALGAVLPPDGASESYMHTLKEEIPTRRFPRPEEVGEAMQPGYSALLALVNKSILDKLKKKAEEYGGEIYATDMPDAVIVELNKMVDESETGLEG
jgi:pteridine reductase